MSIMLLSMVKTPILYTVYEYDKAAFIEWFCENKDRPQLACDGQCKLAEMQREQSEENAFNLLKQLQSETVYVSPVSTPLIDNDQYLVVDKNLPSYYHQLYSFLFISTLVKPPAPYLG